VSSFIESLFDAFLRIKIRCSPASPTLLAVTLLYIVPTPSHAEVMSADCFAAFEEVGLDNEEAVRATGKRFRETVLAMGGGKHPSDVYKAFRGRDPDPAALLRHNGLTK
jgi:hypothetical protein